MAMTERRILLLMIDKFNEEYNAHLNPDDFLIAPITPHSGFRYGFEAKTGVDGYTGTQVRLRLYFNIGTMDRLPKYKMVALDDTDPEEEYSFVTQGNLNRAIVSDSNNIEPITNYDGVGKIDPTNSCIQINADMGVQEW